MPRALKLRRKRVPWGALLVVAALAACAPKEAERPACPPGKTCLLIGNGSEPISLDPHRITGTWESNIVSDSIVGLVQDDAAGRPIPGMAERWETSSDGLTWTFHLRKATWSDGVPVTADDFVFAMRRILLPQTASEYASLLYMIKGAQAVNEGKARPETLGVRAVSPRVLEIRLEHPAPYLAELAKHQTMAPVPKHKVEALGEAWIRPENFVGNGPFRVVAWRLGDYVKAVKNPRFYDADKVCVDEIYYYPTLDAISAERRVLRGELDISNDIQSNRIAFLKEKAPAYVRTHTYLGVSYLAFNTGLPGLKDHKVRTALSMAIDREFIARKLLRGGQLPAYTFVPPGVANYKPAAPPVWAGWSLERRQAAARALMREAGYGPGRPLKVQIKHRNSPDPTLVMPAIQADWAAIGVEASLAQNEVQIAYAAYRTRDFEVADAGWIADFNDAMSFLYLQNSATGAQNYGDYKSPVFDGLLAAADREPDAGKRAGLLAEAESVMLRDASIAPLYFLVNKSLVSPRVTGWVDNIVDHHRSRWLCVRR
jgi:oligopeptide transport system substrate-binding protein